MEYLFFFGSVCIAIEAIRVLRLNNDIKLLFDVVSKTAAISKIRLGDDERANLYIRSAITIYRKIFLILVKGVVVLALPGFIFFYLPKVFALGMTSFGIFSAAFFSLFYWKLRVPNE